MEIQDRKENKRIALAISMHRLHISPGEQSLIDHYTRCHEKGSVPVRHHSGGWYNSTRRIDLILLYLRLSPNLRKLCTRPLAFMNTSVRKRLKEACPKYGQLTNITIMR